MIAARLSQIAAALNARLITGDVAFRGVSTDTRTLSADQLFVALRGERFDAHDFIDQAKAQGAVAAIVERELATDLPQIVVHDSLVALAELARWQRAQAHAKVVGITGSNGKTTVKTLTAAILERAGRTTVTRGNLNNEIGLPLTVLRMPLDTEFAVLEMGAGKPGDIAYLARIAQPQVAVVNNVAAAHLERMGSLQGVAATKGAIYEALPADGVAVINADDAFCEYFAALAGRRPVLRFGIEREAHIRASDLRLEGPARFRMHTPEGEVEVSLRLSGRHNVLNALAAAACALGAGASLRHVIEGLAAAEVIAGRQARHVLPRGTVLIDDAYNANPGSTRAAIDTLAHEPGRRVLVLGNMAELGPDAARLHTEIGAQAKASGLDAIFTVGELARHAADGFGAGARHFADKASLIAALREIDQPPLTLLVKGSRSSAMDEIVRALLGAASAQEPPHAA